MSDNTFNYLSLQFTEGLIHIRYLMDSRYTVMKFNGYINAAVLTIAFSEQFLITDNVIRILAVLLMCLAMMGFSTECATAPYISAYYAILRDIERKLNTKEVPLVLDDTGIVTYGNNCVNYEKNKKQSAMYCEKRMKKISFHTLLPVRRAHKSAYVILFLCWAAVFCCPEHINTKKQSSKDNRTNNNSKLYVKFDTTNLSFSFDLKYDTTN